MKYINNQKNIRYTECFFIHNIHGDYMQNRSIWESNNTANLKKEIDCKIDTDILIIGGGITGLTLSYLLKDYQDKVTLIDKYKIGSGVTLKTTAKISYMQGMYYDIKKYHGLSKAKLYLKSQIEAMNLIVNIIKTNNIKCDLKKVESILFTLDKKGIERITKEGEILKKCNINVFDVFNDSIKAGIKVSDTYVFHPMKYINALKKIVSDNIDIYENTLAKDIKLKNNKWVVRCNNSLIVADKVISVHHYPSFIYPAFIPIKTYIKREYVTAGKVKNTNNYTAINIDKNLHSLRFYGDYLIYTSNKQRLTRKIDYLNNYQKSISDFKEIFKTDVDYFWMNQDVMSHDKLPFIGKVKDNLYISTAYNAWGMTNGVIGAKAIYDLIVKGNSEYQRLFNPKRKNIYLYLNSIRGVFDYLKVYIQALFQKNNPYYIKRKGLIYGIYTDENNNKHKIKLLCPHMKCNLVFNKQEKTWDCPCHGSRFDIDGNLIEGPASKNLNKY